MDTTFAKDQLGLLLRRLYLHPNGQIPAYEWNFGDVNPPVHAWATLFVYELDGHQQHPVRQRQPPSPPGPGLLPAAAAHDTHQLAELTQRQPVNTGTHGASAALITCTTA